MHKDSDYLNEHENKTYKSMAREDFAVIVQEIEKAKTPESKALLEDQRDKLLPILDVDRLTYSHCKIMDKVFDAMAELTSHSRFRSFRG